jgi:hypothetical protein
MIGSLNESIGNPPKAIAAALSDMVHGLNEGYVAYTIIEQTLERGGMTNQKALLDALGQEYPTNLRDSKLQNSAIAAARAVGVPDHATFGDGSLISMRQMDLGLVDYYKLAFRLFGFRTEGFYYLYFVLLGVSIATFLMAYRRSTVELCVPVLFLGAGNIVLNMDVFDDIQVATVTNLRFLSTLGLLPALHLALLMVERRKLTWDHVLAAVIQIALLIFVFSIRSTVAWVLPLFLAIAIFQVAGHLKRLWQGWESSPQAIASAMGASISGCWPVAALLLALLGFQSVVSMQTHPIYNMDDALPHHMRFHNAFLGLEMHPDWQKTFAKDYDFAVEDNLGYQVAVGRLVADYGLPGSYLHSSLGDVRYGLQDRLIKEAYISFIRQHPRFVLEAHAAKVKRLAASIASNIVSSLKSGFVLAVAVFAAVLAALIAAYEALGGIAVLPGVRRICIAAALAELFSWAVVLGAPYQHVIGDQLWIASFSILIAAWALIVTAVSLLLANRGQSTLASSEEDLKPTGRRSNANPAM